MKENKKVSVRLVESVFFFLFFLDRLLGRKRVFFYKFPPLSRLNTIYD